MPTVYRRTLFFALAVSLVTGTTFFIMNNWFVVEGDFGPEKHPWQYPMLKIHGASAFMMMIFFGSLLVTHIPAGWRTKRLRVLGLSLLSVIGFQIITAWLLYYLSNEVVRGWITYGHLAAGWLIPCLLSFHIWKGTSARNRVVTSDAVSSRN